MIGVAVSLGVASAALAQTQNRVATQLPVNAVHNNLSTPSLTRLLKSHAASSAPASAYACSSTAVTVATHLNYPYALTVDPIGNLYITN